MAPLISLQLIKTSANTDEDSKYTELSRLSDWTDFEVSMALRRYDLASSIFSPCLKIVLPINKLARDLYKRL